VEDGVSEVVVVACDEDRQRHQEQSQEYAECTCLLVRKGGVEHEAGRVDHRELVDELHGVCIGLVEFKYDHSRVLTFQGGVEKEAASSDNQVTDEGDEEDVVVFILDAVVDTAEGQPDKQKVGQGVDNLSRVDSGIVVLGLVRLEGRVFKDLYDEPPRTS
jgi:hypothetical protein